MGIFLEWLECKNEAYGFGNDSEEALDSELYGIRESLKNALSMGSLSYRWGDLGQRIAQLKNYGVDKNLVEQANRYYQQIINLVDTGFKSARDSGAQKADIHDPRAKPHVENAIRRAWDYFEPIKKLLAQMSSQSSRSLGHI